MSAIRKLGYVLGKVQSRHPLFFVIIAILITIATLPGIPLLLSNVEPSLEKILPPEIEEVKIMNDMRSQYSADMFYIVIEATDQVPDLLTYDVLTYVDALAASIAEQEYVMRVTTTADALKNMNGANNGILPQNSFELQTAINNVPQSYRLVSDDRSVMFIQIQTDTGASAQTVSRVMDELKTSMILLDSNNPGVKLSITGFSAIDNATFKIIISDFASITLVSFGLMVIFLLLHYNFSVKKTLYSLVIMIFSLLWALGVTGYVGIELNVVTMVAAAMIMALGSSYGINSVYHFYDDFLLQYPKNEAIAKFQEFLIIGLSGSALAEIAGFAALLFGAMPSMRSLGIILGMGIFFSLFVSVVILPAFFFLLEKDTAPKGTPV